MARLMRNPEFRKWQWDHRFDHHIAPINHYIDTLQNGGVSSVPYIPPMYGGINARLLSVLRDPGPKTQGTNGGSGFIGIENDDPTAERLSNLFAEVGIPAEEIVPWNAYPWYINREPTTLQLDAGVLPLKTIIDLLPNLCVVMLHGGDAHGQWKRLKRRYPGMSRLREIEVIETYHTSNKVFMTNAIEKARRKKHLADSFIQAGKILQRGTPSAFSTHYDLSMIHKSTGEDIGSELRVSDSHADTLRNVKNKEGVVGSHEGQKNRNISEGVRISWEYPEVRKKRMQHHAVKVHRNGAFVGEFTSLRQAFKNLGLPDSKHIPFRIKLKQVGNLPFRHGNDIYDFEIRPSF